MKKHFAVVLGGGESGCYAALLGIKNNYDVLVSDAGAISMERKSFLQDNKIAFEEGKHSEELILEAEWVIKSPGIPQTSPIIVKCRDKGVPVLSEIEWAYRFQQSRIIAITGSNGKTTTTRLIHHILSTNGIEATAAGNIGDSFSRYVCGQPTDVVVLELSSFQLEDIVYFKPDIAVLLNITPDHLDRYDYNMDTYAGAKMNMIRNQSEDDFCVYNLEDSRISGHPFLLRGNAIKRGVYIQDWDGHSFKDQSGFTFNQERMPLKGRHNAFNIAAAAEAVASLGISRAQVQSSVESFVNEAHRLEYCGSIEDVRFINDSKATNVDAVYFALEAMQSPVVWLVGGQDKGNDYSVLDDLVKTKVKAILAVGKDNTPIENHFSQKGIPFFSFHSLDVAMQQALAQAQSGDVVLYSPACASFDLFHNYIDRGNQFKKWVMEKKGS